MNNFLYNFLEDKVRDHPETEVIKNLPIYKTPYKNSPEFEKRPYWFLHNKLKKKLYDCLPTLRHPTRPPPTWSELMNTPLPPGWPLPPPPPPPAVPSGDANLADSFRTLDEKVQIKKLRLWILGCLSAKNQTWQDFLNDRIRAARNLGVSSNGTGLGDILYNFEKKCERDYNNKLETAGPGALELARRQRGRRQRGRRAEMGQLADQIRQRERAEQDLRDELERLEAAATSVAARRQELEDEAYARRQRGRRASAATPGGNELFNRAELEELDRQHAELDRQHAEEIAREEDELVARGSGSLRRRKWPARRRKWTHNAALIFRVLTKVGAEEQKKKEKNAKEKNAKADVEHAAENGVEKHADGDAEKHAETSIILGANMEGINTAVKWQWLHLYHRPSRRVKITLFIRI